MTRHGFWDGDKYNATDRIYRFGNSCSIEFTAYDDIEKAKAADKRDVLFINEANGIAFAIADALMIRTSKIIFIDYNPTHRFWAHNEVIPSKDAEFLLLKYTDNEYLEPSIKQDLLSRIEKAKDSEYWANWCRVYIDGEIGVLQTAIFHDWDVVDSIPTDAKYIGTGVDFGFSVDPAAVVDVFEYNKQLYLHEYIYETGLTDEQLVTKIKGTIPDWKSKKFIYDSSDPKAAKVMRDAGLTCLPSIKGADSVEHGIKLMQSRFIHITKSSKNLTDEFTRYQWEEDKTTGEAIPKPKGGYDHGIDASRYSIARHYGVKKFAVA